MIYRTLKMPLDAEFDGDQLWYYGLTPDSERNAEKIASKMRRRMSLMC